jgi:hypothetical protein
MDRYRRRIAMLFVGAQLGCPVRRRIEGEIEIARPVEIVFETTPKPYPDTVLLQPGAPAVRGESPGHDGVPRHATNGGTVPQLQPSAGRQGYTDDEPCRRCAFVRPFAPAVAPDCTAAGWCPAAFVTRFARATWMRCPATAWDSSRLRALRTPRRMSRRRGSQRPRSGRLSPGS